MTDDQQLPGAHPPPDGPDAETRVDIPVRPPPPTPSEPLALPASPVSADVPAPASTDVPASPAPGDESPAPGQTMAAPGQTISAPGQTAAAPGQTIAAPVRDRPGIARPVVLAAVALLLIWIVGLGLLYAMGFFGSPSAPTGADATPTGGEHAAVPTGTADSPAPTEDAQTPSIASPGGSSAPLSSGPAPTGDPPPTATVELDAQGRLLSHVPPDIRSGCTIEPGTPPALAVASCPADDGKILATYFLYDDPAAMEAAYDGFVAESEIERNSGRCSDVETWPSEGSYSISENPAGRVLCMEFSDAPTIYWTDTRLNILTWAFHFEGDAERLYQFWELEAGPGL